MQLVALKNTFPHLTFEENFPLAHFTYMKVGGPAKMFVEIRTTADLFEVVSFCFKNNIPFVVLGGCSNVVIPDKGIDKLVIKNNTSTISIDTASVSLGGAVLVTADSGVVTATLANKTMQENLTGLEVFVGVPGTVGGAIYNNSHFTSQDLIGNYITSVEVCSDTGAKLTWKQEELEFGYDTSIFQKKQAVIVSATFSLKIDDPGKIRERMLTAAQKRADTQPIGVPSSGCMYKNPFVSSSTLRSIHEKVPVPESAIKASKGDLVQIAAGFLIDKAGLKGRKIGGAQVSEKHATFLINTGNATATDVEELARTVEATVVEKFGVQLEREVFFL